MKIKERLTKIPFCNLRSSTLTIAALASLFSTVTSAATITSGMSPEIVTEFNKQLKLQEFTTKLKLQKFTTKSDRLIMMTNPYTKFMDVIDDSINDKTVKGFNPKYHRRLMTHEETTLHGKLMRFSECQNAVSTFVGVARAAHAETQWDIPPSKHQILSHHGIEYPFTKEEANDGDTRPVQVALELAWKYQGKGEEYIDTFFSTCLAIPISLYYWKDEFDEDE